MLNAELCRFWTSRFRVCLIGCMLGHVSLKEDASHDYLDYGWLFIPQENGI